jgi:2,3-bisphosphoglycerate-independent phosphoglycerate mutase
MVVMDGAADRPEEELHGATPLELARTPHLDAIAERARGGMLRILPSGGAPQTHSGMLSLLGYPDVAVTAKRGALEGSVIFGGMRPGCVYARGNLSAMVDGRVISRRVNRDITQAEADAICILLNRAVPGLSATPCHFKSYSTYRLAVEITVGDAPTDAVTGTDPGYSEDEFAVPKPQDGFAPAMSRALERTAAANRVANAVNAITRACHTVLERADLNAKRRAAGRLPVNHVLLRDFGVSLPSAEPFSDRWGLTAKYYHDLPVELGVARYLHMDEEKANCGAVNRRVFEDAASRLVGDLAKYDFICFHVKGPDEPGHDGNWKAKVRAIEIVDEGLFARLALELDRRPVTLAITSDHATCWAVRTHTGDPVPIIVTGTGTPDGRLRLSEAACAQGTFPITEAWKVMTGLTNLGRT